ncbi:hypothetical protein DFJ73DRAFT_843037 [Zopfochytrium polystomum]|nr:hypothetical protein DFJ73DRAFT_843037 [Zopfochytrium polystomum]
MVLGGSGAMAPSAASSSGSSPSSSSSTPSPASAAERGGGGGGGAGTSPVTGSGSFSTSPSKRSSAILKRQSSVLGAPRWDPSDVDYLEFVHDPSAAAAAAAAAAPSSLSISTTPTFPTSQLFLGASKRTHSPSSSSPADLLAADRAALKELRRLYAQQFSRLRDETQFLSDRAARLDRLGVNPQIADVTRMKTMTLAVGERMPWQELAVAVVGTKGVGKSSILGRLIGRPNLLGGADTTHHYALVHSKHAHLYSSKRVKVRGAAERTANVVVVSHRLNKLENVTFFDTIPIPTPRHPPPRIASGPSRTFRFSGLDVNDPIVVSVSAVSPEPAVSHPQSASASDPLGSNAPPGTTGFSNPIAVYPAHPFLDLDILEAELIDVLVGVVTPENLVTFSHDEVVGLKTALAASLFPILVVNKMDDVWESVGAQDYRQWRTDRAAAVMKELGIPPSQQFYVSTTQSSPFNEMKDLEEFIEELINQRKSAKTLTSVKRLGSFAEGLSAFVSSQTSKLQAVSQILEDTHRNLLQSTATQSDLDYQLRCASIRAFFAAFRDVGLSFDLGHSPASAGSIIPAAANYAEAAGRNDFYLMARYVELGVGNPPPVEGPRIEPRLASARAAAAQRMSKEQHAATGLQALALYLKAEEQQQVPADRRTAAEESEPDAEQNLQHPIPPPSSGERISVNPVYAAAAALRLSHIYRPSSVSVSGNSRESLRHLRLAAARGHPAALTELARAFEIGDCVESNLNSAAAYYARAADLGEPGAILAFARYLLYGTAEHAVARDPVRGVQVLSGIVNAGLATNISRVQDDTLPIVAVEAALELARLFDGSMGSPAITGVPRDPSRATDFREKAENIWQTISVRLIGRIWQIMTGEEPGLRTEYGMRCFLDRLQDQLRLHVAEVRTRMARGIRSSFPASAASSPPVSRGNTVVAGGLPTPSVLSQQGGFGRGDALTKAKFRLQGHVLDSILAAWRSGTIDEEADVKADPSGDVSSAVAASLQECLTIAFPGFTGTADLAEAISGIWVSSGLGDSRVPVPSTARTEALLTNPITRFLSQYSRFARTEAANDAARGGAEALALGETISNLFKLSWRASVDRLSSAISSGARPFTEGASKEVKLWAKRQRWANDLAQECSRRLRTSLDRGIGANLVKAARAAVSRTEAGEESENRGKMPEEKAIEDVSALNVVNLSKLPFVWEGASVVMSSQLLDEVTGSFAKSLYDWNADNANKINISQVATMIDRCLDAGLTAYSNPSTSPGKSAMTHWQEAHQMAERSGDLIREANALCNIGGASRMMGRYQASIQYLDLAWRKSCTYISLASRHVPSSLSLGIIKSSLTSDRVNVDRHSLVNDPNWARTAGAALANTDWSLAQGPAVVVWFMRLLVSLGHGNLAVGRVDIAGQWYDGCISLCKSVLAQIPIPVLDVEQTPTSAKDSTLSRRSTIKKVRSKKLTYLQRTTVLLLVRAYTHRGLCCSSLGDMDEAVRCQTRALDLLTVHGPSIGDPETTYRATIEANLGGIHHSRGRLAAAVSHHARSAMLFLQVEDHQAQARELANLGALWIEIGKTLRSLEWVRGSDPVISAALGAVHEDQESSGDDSTEGKGGESSQRKGKGRSIMMRRKMRLVTAEDVAVDPDRIYRVVRPHFRASDSDLDMALEVGELVTVVMVMEDGVSALGQKRDGNWQGTFPLSCIEIEDESGEMEVMSTEGPDTAPVYNSYSELLIRLSELMNLRNSGLQVPAVEAKPAENLLHCGEPYVEFGLGLLRDVIRLECETAEVAINIAAGEILLNQPYRAIRSLLRLIEGTRFAGTIPHSLRKYAALTLTSAFLMIALANEDPTQELQFWPDGSSRFLDSHQVDTRLLNQLLSSLGVPNPSINLSKLTRSDVFPILQACLNMSTTMAAGDGGAQAEYFSGPVGPLDAMVSAILGTLEWITGVWIEDVDAEEAAQWKETGNRRVEDAIEKQAFAVHLFGNHTEPGEGLGVDGRKLGGDAGVFTVGAGLAVMEHDRKRQLLVRARSRRRSGLWTADTEAGGASAMGSTSGVGSGSPDLLVWSWAVNSSRLQVCSKCAPRALEVAIHGSAAATVGDSSGGPSSEEPFPCPHHRGIDETTEAMADLVLGDSSRRLSASRRPRSMLQQRFADLGAIPEGLMAAEGLEGDAGDDEQIPEYNERDPLTVAAEEVMGALVRRVTGGRLRDLEKARLADRRRGQGTRKPPLVKRLEEDQPPAWMDEMTSKELSGGSGGLLPAEDFAQLLKKLASVDGGGDDKLDSSTAKKPARWFKREATWVNLFYKDATQAVKRTGIMDTDA